MKQEMGKFKLFNRLKIMMVLIAGTLNVYGIWQLLQGIATWNSFIVYSMYALALTIAFSALAGSSKKKVIERAYEAVIKEYDLVNPRKMRVTERILMIESEGVHYTLSVFIQKSGVGVIFQEAKASVETDFIGLNGEVTKVELEFMPEWESPDWELHLKKDEHT